MANRITQSPSLSSLVRYLDYAETLLSKPKEPIPLVDRNGDAHPYMLKEQSSVNAAAIAQIKKLRQNILQKKGGATKADQDNFRDTLNALKIDLVSPPSSFAPTVGRIMKSTDRINRGNIGEAVLQAAITARFIDARPQTSKVTESQIVKHLEQFLKIGAREAGSKSKTIKAEIRGDGPNQDRKLGYDDVTTFYQLDYASFSYLKSKSSALASDPSIKSFITDSIAYVNKGTVREHSNYFFTNGRSDKIDIVAMGVKGQGKTTSDVRVSFYEGYVKGRKNGNPETVRLDISVKINDISQVAQVSGLEPATWDALATALGVELGKNTLDEINTIYTSSGKGIRTTFTRQTQISIYKTAHERLKVLLNGTPSNNIWNGINRFLKGMEMSSEAGKTFERYDFELVNIGTGLKTYFFKNLDFLKATYGTKPLKVAIRSTPKTYFLLVGVDAPGDMIIIDSHYTGGQYRNYILVGDKLRTLLAEARL